MIWKNRSSADGGRAVFSRPGKAGCWPTGQGGAGRPPALRGTGGRRGEVTPPYGSTTGGAQQRADVGIGPYALRGRGRHAEVVVPYGGKSRKGSPLPGFRRLRRKEVGSFFAAACTWRKILLTERRVKRVRPLWGPDPFCAKAECEAPPAVPEGPQPSCRHAARGRGNLKGKQPKRRQWRSKRGCFEAAARLAAPNRGRESECRNGADEVPPLSS